MEFSEVIETQKNERGSVAPINDPSTENENETEKENDQVSVQGEVTPAEVFQAIGDVLENGWLALTDNTRDDLDPDGVLEWVDTLQWAVEVMPDCYEMQHEIVQLETDYWEGVVENGEKHKTSLKSKR